MNPLILIVCGLSAALAVLASVTMLTRARNPEDAEPHYRAIFYRTAAFLFGGCAFICLSGASAQSPIEFMVSSSGRRMIGAPLACWALLVLSVSLCCHAGAISWSQHQKHVLGRLDDQAADQAADAA